MRENRLSGSEGGATLIPSSLPLSIVQSLRDAVSRPHHEVAKRPQNFTRTVPRTCSGISG